MAFKGIQLNNNIFGNDDLVFGDEIKEEIKGEIESNSDSTSLEAKDNVQHIEKFFPASHDIEIPLTELDAAPNEWNFFKLPDEETFKLIMKSIYYQGQLSPALVWKQENGRYMILGGHTRFAAIKLLGELYPDEPRFSMMKCHVYEYEQLDEAAAKFIIITNNMTQRAQEAPSVMVTSIVKALDLQKKIKKETWGEIKGSSAEVVAQTLGISDSKVKRYYRLRNLIPVFLYMLDNGTLSQAQALSIADLSCEIQSYIAEHEYYTIKDSRFKKMLKATSTEEVEEIAKSDERYVFNGKAMTYEIPKSFSKFSLAVDKEDEETVRLAIMEAIEKLELKNSESKRILLDVLNNM